MTIKTKFEIGDTVYLYYYDNGKVEINSFIINRIEININESQFSGKEIFINYYDDDYNTKNENELFTKEEIIEKLKNED